jgi:hypothetical protein
MKRVIKYFWHSIKSSFKHKIGEVTHNPKTTQYYNVWTNKVWIE